MDDGRRDTRCAVLTAFPQRVRYDRAALEIMELIVTHDVSDFDGIAASVAARHLYPAAKMVRRRILASEVEIFLGVHRGRFPFMDLGDVHQASVERLILVDVHRRSRMEPDFDAWLRRFERSEDGLEVHVYDHHGPAVDDIRGDVEHVEQLGAVTTLMVEILRDRGTTLDPIEATLHCLGIYSDTGALTYATTTARDVRAVHWLLEQGAELSVVSRFLEPPCDERQRDLLARGIQSLVVGRVAMYDVGFAIVPLRRSISGMAWLTTQILRFSRAQLIFGVYPIGANRVQVIARAGPRAGDVDLGALLRPLGGGGHTHAGAVKFRNISAEAVVERLRSALEQRPSNETGLEALMRPSETSETLLGRERVAVEVGSTLEDVIITLRRHDVDHVDVVDGRRVVGSVARDDVMRVLYAPRATEV